MISVERERPRIKMNLIYDTTKTKPHRYPKRGTKRRIIVRRYSNGSETPEQMDVSEKGKRDPYTF